MNHLIKFYLCYLLVLAPGLSFAQTESLIFTTFYQGARDNCASVALIKAAMYKYGVGQVVAYQRNQGGVHVKLRNGKELDLTNDEIASARAADGFIPSGNAQTADPIVAHIFTYADTLYAVEAKYISLFGYDGCQGNSSNNDYDSYAKALSFISKPGVCTDYVYHYLGLTTDGTINNYTSQTNFSTMRGVILYSNPHAIAVYLNNGDGYGTLTPVGSVMRFGGIKFKPVWYIVLQ